MLKNKKYTKTINNYMDRYEDFIKFAYLVKRNHPMIKEI